MVVHPRGITDINGLSIYPKIKSANSGNRDQAIGIMSNQQKSFQL